MADTQIHQQDRINAKMEEIKSEFDDSIRNLLQEMNKSRLKGKGKVSLLPIVERNSLRWTLGWKTGKVSIEMSVIVRFEDTGQTARVAGAWVHRHASTPIDYDGHTPTTKMRRLNSLSIAEIQEAMEAEWV